MKNKNERINKLIEVLQQRKGMTVKELSSVFAVSEMTVRRDLDLLRKNGLILNIPGAAIFNPENSSSAIFEPEATGALSIERYSLVTAKVKNSIQKDAIGRYAANLVKDDDCVIIDNGTTTERLAANLPPSLNATILTCNLNILNSLAQKPNISIICSGGYYHPDLSFFESSEGVALIKKSRATKVFCSAGGIHETMGVTCMTSYEVEIKRAIMDSGAEKILLADSSKFGFIKSCYIADLVEFDVIITDADISNEWKELIQAKGIELVIV